MNQAVVYYSGRRYHKDLISAHILCCFAESSTPINKVEDHIISPGFGSTFTGITFLPKMEIYRLIHLTAFELLQNANSILISNVLNYKYLA